MEKFSLKNLLKELPLLVSAVAALCLFVVPAKIVILLVGGVFALVLAAVLFGVAKPEPFTCKYRKGAAWLIAIHVALVGFYGFYNTWTYSSLLASVAGMVGLEVSVLVLLVGIAGCVVGAYALHTLGCWTVVWCVQYLRETDMPAMMRNLLRNWYFPVSALAFFLMARVVTPEEMEFTYTDVTADFFLGVPAVLMAAAVVATQMPEPKELRKLDSAGWSVMSALTAAGICLARYDWSDQSVFNMLCAVAAFPAVYVCVSALWRYLRKNFRETGLFAGVGKKEFIFYGLLLAATLTFVAAVFLNTDAFYATAYKYDIIYTSDAPILVRENAYMNLTHSQNDLRQPLFAVCAAPFVGWAYLASLISPVWWVILMNFAQVGMLFAANFMLTKVMKLEGIQRVCFMVLLCCGYPYLLFSLMMEQYIVAYFWLVLLVYLASEKRADGIVLAGAGGSLLTSVVLVPLTSQKNPLKDFRGWFWDMVNRGVEFLMAIFAFGRMDVIRNIAARTDVLTQFTGKELTILDKFYQYTAFVAACFTAPAAGVNYEVAESVSWQLEPVTGLSLAGVVILVLAAVSAVLNREKLCSRIAAVWVAFSFGVLCILGWGTQENGLILYALYFGWAFIMLLYQLVQWLGERAKMPFLTPAVSAVAAVWMLLNNIPAMAELIGFALGYYAR